MNVTYERKEAMTFIGYHTKIPQGDGYAKCPEFWDREYHARFARLRETGKPETALERAVLDNGVGGFAICADGEGSFTYWIAGLYRGGEEPEGLELCSFPASLWAVFTARGPLPASLQALNTAVWQEWYPGEGQKYQPNGMATLEVYSAGDPQAADYESGIWVPVK